MRRLMSFWVWLSLFLMACNLGSAPTQPPTLAPRPTVSPQPPLGLSTDGGSESLVAANVNTAITTNEERQRLFMLLNEVDTSNLMTHATNLQNFKTRWVNSTTNSALEGIGAARTYLANEFLKLQQQSNGRLYTFNHEFELNYQGVKTIQQNVVAVVSGSEPGAGFIIVGAHYDSIVFPEGPTAYAPGGNDNATGVAALLELARIVSQTPHRSSIMFVAFSAEEVGRKGSIAFANYLVERNVDVLAMINIDTIGNVEDKNGLRNSTELRVFSQGPNDASTHRHLARTVEFISFTEGLDLKLTVQDAIDRETRYGDHFSFTEKGYPSIRFINAFEEKNNGDPGDTVDFVEQDYFRKATQAILAVIVSLADGPRPPQNVALRPQEGGIYQLVWDKVPDATSYVVALRWPGSLRYDQQIEVTQNQIEWDGFGSYEGVAISAKDKDGVVGPLSPEYRVPK